jgi:hypothetical protein
MANADNCSEGKKILFVYPNKPVLDNIVPSLVSHGYEPYILDHHEYTGRICTQYKDSIVFLNIDQSIRKSSWGEQIKSLKSNGNFGGVDIGVMSGADPDSIITSFSDLPFNIACLSFLHGIDFCRQVILNFLEKNNAKGKRRHVRVKCNNIYHASFSIKNSSSIVAGQILDISTAGMACTFSENIQLHPGSALNNLQLRLMGTMLMISGKVAGIRDNNGVKTYVIMFDTIHDDYLRHKLVAFISHMLQENIKPLLA